MCMLSDRTQTIINGGSQRLLWCEMGDLNHRYDMGESSPLAVMGFAHDGYMGSTHGFYLLRIAF